MSREKFGTVITLLSGASFGTLAVFAKLAYAGGANVPTVLLLRFVGAAAAFWLYFSFRGHNLRYERAVIIKLLAMGALGYGTMSAFFLLSASRVEASLTGMLLYLYPAMVTTVTVLLKQEKINRYKGGALVISFIGMLLILGVSFTKSDPLGVLFGLGAPCVYTAYIVYGSRVIAKLEPLKATLYIMTGAGLAYTAVGLFSGTISFAFTLVTWLVIAGMVFISTILAVVSFWWGVKLIGPARASIVSTVEPLVTVILSWAAFGEVLTTLQLCGGALILSGVLLQNRTDKPLINTD